MPASRACVARFRHCPSAQGVAAGPSCARRSAARCDAAVTASIRRRTPSRWRASRRLCLRVRSSCTPSSQQRYSVACTRPIPFRGPFQRGRRESRCSCSPPLATQPPVVRAGTNYALPDTHSVQVGFVGWGLHQRCPRKSRVPSTAPRGDAPRRYLRAFGDVLRSASRDPNRDGTVDLCGRDARGRLCVARRRARQLRPRRCSRRGASHQ